MLFKITSWSSHPSLYRCRWRAWWSFEKKYLWSVLISSTLPSNWLNGHWLFFFFAMALNEVQGLLLPVAYVLVYLLQCQVISLLPCVPTVSVSGIWLCWFSPGPANTLASLAESKQSLSRLPMTSWKHWLISCGSSQITSITITWNQDCSAHLQAVLRTHFAECCVPVRGKEQESVWR
jgi:hypothetical protein